MKALFVSRTVRVVTAAVVAAGAALLVLQSVQAQAIRGPEVPAMPIGEADWRTVAPENLLVIDTTKGRVLVEMEPRAAPGHVARISQLANQGFFDGQKWHRVIPGFMAQTGDPLGTGEGGSDLPDLAGEFSFRRGRDGFGLVPNAGGVVRGWLGSLPIETQPDAQMFVTADMKVPASGLFCPGVLGMARSQSPDSANSQFFLMTGTNPNLNGSYTAFGRVVVGLDVVKALNAGSSANNGAVANPDIMTRARIAASIPPAERPAVRVLDPRTAPFAARVQTLRESRGLNFNICDIPVVAEATGG
ncbi:peptidylprolyl isomerase [Brevundimonas sp.]|uniref:peptidylprolyl isomerase n=1 Tax=Brevundimonas sp. TaxID=1871086 RepID=UPI001A1F0FFA|nr:peptidylprolyl isomerase [Brevundimonas sp.]MBJ7486079.1 peptidylprolyl isomerase [Brevundimonas sp.]